MGSPDLIDFPRASKPTSGDGGGGGHDARLRAVELDMREIKTELKHLATSRDIQEMAAGIEAKLSNQLKWLLGTSGVLFLGAAGIIIRLLTLPPAGG